MVSSKQNKNGPICDENALLVERRGCRSIVPSLSFESVQRERFDVRRGKETKKRHHDLDLCCSVPPRVSFIISESEFLAVRSDPIPQVSDCWSGMVLYRPHRI